MVTSDGQKAVDAEGTLQSPPTLIRLQGTAGTAAQARGAAVPACMSTSDWISLASIVIAGLRYR
jgi:hypothetical protein